MIKDSDNFLGNSRKGGSDHEDRSHERYTRKYVLL